MKRKVSRVVPLGLTAVFLMALSLFTAQPANAANVTIYGEDLAAVTCNAISAGSDNITIISGSTVTINGNVTMGSNRLIIGAGVGYSNPIPGLEEDSTECPGAKMVTAGISFTGDGSAKLTITGNVTSSSSFDISLVTFETEIEGDVTTTGTGKVISNGEFKLRNGTLKLSRNLSAGANVDIIADDDIESEGISSTLGSVKLESTGSIKATAGSGTSGGISAFNEVEIKTTANDKTIEIAGAISSNQGWVIVQTSTSSSGSLIKIDSSITTHGQTIMLLAGGNVKAGDLNIHKDDNTADIRIFANQAGGGSTFIIGGSGNSNGVNGTITNTSDNGSFSGEQTRAVYVSNKNGIQITNGNKIVASGSATRAAAIMLDAHSGNIELQAGTLSADGSGSNAAGLILLVGTQLCAS